MPWGSEVYAAGAFGVVAALQIIKRVEVYVSRTLGSQATNSLLLLRNLGGRNPALGQNRMCGNSLRLGFRSVVRSMQLNCPWRPLQPPGCGDFRIREETESTTVPVLKTDALLLNERSCQKQCKVLDVLGSNENVGTRH